MFCKNCGSQIDEDVQTCSICGTDMSEKGVVRTESNPQTKCLPSFILGLIGGICGMFGGLCTSMCNTFTGDFSLLFIFGGSIIGLVGACLCLSKAKIGALVELAAALMITICAIGITGTDFMGIMAMLLFWAGGITGTVYSFVIKMK